MNRTFFSYAVPAVFIAVGAAAAWLFFNPDMRKSAPAANAKQTRLVMPQNSAAPQGAVAEGTAERMAYEDIAVSKVALEDGELLAAVITQDFDGDPQDEQIIAYRRAAESEGPIHISYVDFDEISGGYRRVWSAATATTKPRTLGLYAKDLVGDRSVCVVVTGLNDAGEQTLTAFRKVQSAPDPQRTFEKIAELRVDGSIVIQESERSQAYQLGLASDKSFTISTYGRDYESANILDQIEVSYAYDAVGGRYERFGTARIPGTQMEQRRVRDLLDGTPGKFESFLEGLWYYAGPDTAQGEKRYLFFDPRKREIIFYFDDTQEVFLWQNSNATRYGIYISSQNISVTTLRRLIDIELESVDGVRIKMFEDVKLKIGVTGRWDGSYRKASATEGRPAGQERSTDAWIDETYEGQLGRVKFRSDGSYETAAGDGVRRGRYAFFRMDNLELLEFRPQDAIASAREVYAVERPAGPEGDMVLTKVRLGLRGLESLHEGALRLRRQSAPN